MKLAVLSDIHGNLEAFQAVLADIKNQTPDAIINLGDIIGYGPDPGPCIDRLREENIPSTMGNHEWVLLKQSHRKWFNVSSRDSVEITANLLREDQIDFAKSLPVNMLWHNTLCVHGAPPDSVVRYLHQYSDKALARALDKAADQMGVNICFVGHTHDLMYYERDEVSVERYGLPEGETFLKKKTRYIVNVGAVGQPRDDYDNKAKYILWEPDEYKITVRSVSYDIETTIEKMKERGFPERFIKRLKP